VTSASIPLRGKKVIVFGERDDVPAPTISRCLAAAGAEVVYESTSCFV
jgi:glycine reductase